MDMDNKLPGGTSAADGARPRKRPGTRGTPPKSRISKPRAITAVPDPLAMEPVQRYAAIIAARALKAIRPQRVRSHPAGSYLGVMSLGWRWTPSMVDQVMRACDSGRIGQTALLSEPSGAAVSRAKDEVLDAPDDDQLEDDEIFEEVELIVAGELPNCTMRKLRESHQLREQAQSTYNWANDDLTDYLLRTPRLLNDLCDATLHFLDAERDPAFVPAREPEGSLLRNADHLAAVFGLNPTERELVRLAIVAHRIPLLRQALDESRGNSVMDLQAQLADLIARPFSEVTEAVRSKGALRSFDILADVGGIDRIEEFVRLDDMAAQLCCSYKDRSEFLRRYIQPVSQTSTFGVEDFNHLGRSLVQIRQLLLASRDGGRHGVNVLLYGAPGVGKTQLVHALARSLDFELFEVSGGSGQESASRRSRLAHLRMADSALSCQPRSLLMFDEASDVLDPPGLLDFFSRGSGNGQSKLWMNQLLENNQVPTVWIANQVKDVDPAHLRRFVLTVEVPAPDRRARQRMTDDILGPHGVSAATRNAIAAMADLTPAELQSAARYIELTTPAAGAGCTGDGPGHAAGDPDQRAIDQIGAQRRALGQPAPNLRTTGPDYDPRFVNLEGAISLDAIVARLQQGKALRICASGPAGTGKSQLAHYLADLTGRELVNVGASSLLSKYVGESEAQVARLFARINADPERKILLIDEIDSFLSDRETQRDWMQGLTNEFLRQLDGFSGTLIATTNLPLALDGAAARRFDVQLEFKPLTQAQRLAMFPHSFGMDLPAHLEGELISLEALVPADFAKVRTQRDLLGQGDDPAALIQQLSQAMRVRCGAGRGRAIGF